MLQSHKKRAHGHMYLILGSKCFVFLGGGGGGGGGWWANIPGINIGVR